MRLVQNSNINKLTNKLQRFNTTIAVWTFAVDWRGRQEKRQECKWENIDSVCKYERNTRDNRIYFIPGSIVACYCNGAYTRAHALWKQNKPMYPRHAHMRTYQSHPFTHPYTRSSTRPYRETDRQIDRWTYIHTCRHTGWFVRMFLHAHIPLLATLARQYTNTVLMNVCF